MSSIVERSFFVHYWEFSVPILILFVTVFYFRYGDKKKKTIETVKLDGEDYIKADYEDSDQVDNYVPALDEIEHVPFSGASITLPGGAEAFYEIANNRRSVRSYSSKNVPFSVIESCIKAAGTAPSGAHTEPWTFCVVSDPSIKSEIRNIVEAEEYLNYSQRMHRQWTTDLKPLRTNHIKEYLTEAPYLILIFKQTYGLKADGSRKQHYYNEVSVSIATGILLCALQAAGLCSLVTTPLNSGPALKLLLNREKNEKLLVLLPVGYPSDNCKVPSLTRKSVDKILVRY